MKIERNYKEQKEEMAAAKESSIVLFITFRRSISAFDVSQRLAFYGDNYVVKDNDYSSFVEFNFLDEENIGRAVYNPEDLR